MRQRFILYQHAGSGNHGCEALVRTVILTIKEIWDDAEFLLISSDPQADVRYGVTKIQGLELVSLNKCIKKGNLNWFLLQLGKLLHSSALRLNASFNAKWMKQKNAIYIAIGGDNYCYNKGKAFFTIDNAIQGKKILWGCSIEPKDIDNELIEHLEQFDVISAREPLSLHALIETGLNNVVYAPDTAFLLPAILPSVKKEEYVGINISPMILNYAENADVIIKNYRKLIQYILETSEMKIMFVPHVISEKNDDRIAISKLIQSMDIPENRYRVIPDQNCMELKGWIGLCKFFIGARTHSTIAAYSQNIPTLVMGYSVKSIGIAEDLFGTSEKYVIPVNSLDNEDALLSAFKWLSDNENLIRRRLEVQVKEKKEIILQSYQKIMENKESSIC